MSNRERWIIYPLLLFAFLLAARDKYVKPEHIQVSRITCEQLTIASMDDRRLITIGASPNDAGVIAMYGPTEHSPLPGVEAVDLDDLRSPGHRTVEMGANEDGGYVRVFGARPGLDLHVGHNAERQVSGYVAMDEHGQFVNVPEEAADCPVEVWGTVMQWHNHQAREESSDQAEEEEPEAGDEGVSDSDDDESTAGEL